MPELLVINSGGLGSVMYQLSDPAAANACGLTYASYLFQPLCWGASWDEWQAAFYNVKNPPANVVAAPGAPSSVYTNPNQVAPDTTGQTGQDLSNQAIGQTQQNVQNWYDTSILGTQGTPQNPLCLVMNCDVNNNPQPTTQNYLVMAGLVLGGMVVLRMFFR